MTTSRNSSLTRDTFEGILFALHNDRQQGFRTASAESTVALPARGRSSALLALITSRVATKTALFRGKRRRSSSFVDEQPAVS